MIFRKTDLKSIDFVAASFRRELESDNFWQSSQTDSDEENSLPTSTIISRTDSNSDVNQEETLNMSILVRANYNFTAESDKEMSLNKGDMIKVIKKVDEGWWVGTCNGKSGMFPSNYVSLLENTEQDIIGEKLDSLSLKNSNQEDSNISQSVAKPGFSYLPQGMPITFIGRKSTNEASQSNQIKEHVEMSCGQCDCDEFAANVFKAGHCNNCFHKH